MMFELDWMPQAKETYLELEEKALKSRSKGKSKSSLPEGLFKQVVKTLKLLRENPRHPSLNTHPYSSYENPIDPREKVFEAYIQKNTPGAYRVFWCYGKKNVLMILAITPHP